jgi:hypothetical protein
MRGAIVIVAIILAIIFAGGVINVGGAPLFARIDSGLRITFLMDLHYTLFSFAHRGEQGVEGTVGRAKGRADDLQQKAEFGKRQKYKRLDAESSY